MWSAFAPSSQRTMNNCIILQTWLTPIFLPAVRPLHRRQLFQYATELYGKKWLYQMLAFDAFIGNEDRHENNFDVIVRDGKNYAPPIYDNGGSLLAWAIDEELTDTKLRYQFDKAKPFRSRHAQQIKLIDEPVLPVRDLDTLYQEIMQAISPILALLSEKRASAIRQYLKYRLHYLKAAMG